MTKADKLSSIQTQLDDFQVSLKRLFELALALERTALGTDDTLQTSRNLTELNRSQKSAARV